MGKFTFEDVVALGLFVLAVTLACAVLVAGLRLAVSLARHLW
jgi:hypothetical protein